MKKEYLIVIISTLLLIVVLLLLNKTKAKPNDKKILISNDIVIESRNDNYVINNKNETPLE